MWQRAVAGLRIARLGSWQARRLCSAADQAAALPKIGIIRLDYDWQKLKGDIDDVSTYHTMGFDIEFAKVEGFSFVNAQQGMKDGKFRDSFITHEECAAFDALDPTFQRDPSKSVQTAEGRAYSGDSIQASMVAAIRKLEEKGVSYITGNCGFMMNFQEFVANQSDTPVMMSSLMQLPMLVRSLGRDELLQQVVVLTANSESFYAAWDSLIPPQWGIPRDQVIVVGCQDIPGFGTEVAQGLQHNPTRAAPAMCKEVVKQITANGDRSAAILLECTELPLYVQPLRNVTGLPTYDVVTMIQFANMGAAGGKLSALLERSWAYSRLIADQTQWVDQSRERPAFKPKIGVLRLDTWFGDDGTLPFPDHDTVAAQLDLQTSDLQFEFVYKRLEGVTRQDCLNGVGDGPVTWPSDIPPSLKSATAQFPKLAALVDFKNDTECEEYQDDIYLPMQPWDWPVVKACNFLGLQYTPCGASTQHLMVSRRSGSKVGVDASGNDVFEYTEAQKLESLQQAVNELERAGVTGIVGDCGEMVSLTPLIAKLSDVPVIMSPLAQIGFMASALAGDEKVKVVVCVADKLGDREDGGIPESFWKKHAPPTAHPLWNEVHFVSLYDVFQKEETKEGASKQFIKAIKDDAQEHGHKVGALLLLNAEMPLYKEALLNEFNVPVRDLTSMLAFLELGHVQADYSE